MIQTLFGSLNEPPKQSVFDRMKQAVSRTRETLNNQIEGVLALTREVDESTIEELETVLIASDIGVATTTEIVDALRERAKRQGIRDGAELKDLLKEQLRAILDENSRPARVVAIPP
jgi:fused signal recognition particle receptor